MQKHCIDCEKPIVADEFYTEVNPPGGYDLPQALVCDDCMRSGRWDYWKSEHWPNWPEVPISFETALDDVCTTTCN